MLVRDSITLDMLSNGTLLENAFGDAIDRDSTLEAVIVHHVPKELLIPCLRVILESIANVRQRQLSPYITGAFSEVSEETLQNTTSAATSNIFAERALGMMDRFIRNNKQATTDFLEARVTATLNKTLPWLCEHVPSDQECIVDFAIKMGSVLRTEYCDRRKSCRDEINKRNICRGKQKDNATRSDREKVLRSCILNKSVDLLLLNPLFSDIQIQNLPETLQAFFKSILHMETPRNEFCHRWEESDGTDEWYHGSIQCIQSRRTDNVPTYLIKYIPWGFSNSLNAIDWDDNESFTKMRAEELLHDILFGDLKLP